MFVAMQHNIMCSIFGKSAGAWVYFLSVLSYYNSDTAFSLSKYTYRTRIKVGRLVIGCHTLIQVCLLDKPSAF